MRLDREKIQTLQSLHKQRQGAIRARLLDFTRVPPSDYFYELAYCLMTPQSSAEHADRAVFALRRDSFFETGFNPEATLRKREHYIRFHKNKAKYLLQIRSNFDLIRSAVTNGRPGSDMREWLVTNVKGLGMKEATHFLRNIGRNEGMAILDRHILRNLKRYGAIGRIPPSLSKKQYLVIEKRFKNFSEEIGVPLDELDLLFWSMETGEIRK